MDDDNYVDLVEQLEYMGFGRDTFLELLNKMWSHQTHFSMQHQVHYGNDKVQSLLQFQKSDETGNYYLDNYKIQILKQHNSMVMKRTIYLNSEEKNISLNEAYNLLEGRAVCKDLRSENGEKASTWIQLDLKEINENGNFILKKFPTNDAFILASILGKYHIKEFSNSENRKQLIESLEMGNRPSITYIKESAEKKLFIDAAPQFRSIGMYDSDMN